MTAKTAPWLCPNVPGWTHQGAGLWANSTAAVRECAARVYRTVNDPAERRALIGALLDMYRLFEVGEVCAPFTAELWRYAPSPAERVEDAAQVRDSGGT